MKQLKTALRMLVLLIVGVFLGVRFYSWNARYLAGNTVPMPFGVGASVVLSGSMEPALSVGDLLVFTEEERYAVGDIVVYQSGSLPVVHRIVSLSDETAITRGDANNTNDKPVPATAIKGKVIAAIPLIGYLVLALKKPMAAVIILTAAVLLVEWSFHIEKAEKEVEQEKIKAEIRALMKELKEK